jgi:hypothetical protein
VPATVARTTRELEAAKVEDTSGYQEPAMSRPRRREVGETTTGAAPIRPITQP